MSVAVSQMARRAAVEAVRGAGYGEKSQIKRQQASVLGVSVATLDRWYRAEFGRTRATRCDKGNRKIVNIEEMVKTVAAYMASFPQDERRISTEDAVMACEDLHCIPRGRLNVNTCNQVLRELGISFTKTACVRMEPKRVNAVWHFDGSGSEYFYVIRVLENGDYLLGSRWSFEKSTKNFRVQTGRNKPKHDGRMQVYYYAAVDGCSRVVWMHAQVAPGESLNDSVAACERMMRGGGASVLRGIPKKIITDNGPLGRSREGQAMCDALGIERYTNEAYNKKANGKVERQWSAAWKKYELNLARKVKIEMNGEITLSRLVEVLADYLAWKNAQQSPSVFAQGRSRAAMYADGIAEHGFTPLPDEANLHELAADTLHRTIDPALRVRINNSFYRVMHCPASLIRRRVRVQLGLDKSVKILNPDTNEWLNCVDYRYLDDGEFRGLEHGENEAAQEAAEQFKGVAAPLPFEGAAEAAAALPENAVNLAERRAQRDGGRFVNLADAQLAFSQAFGKALGELPQGIAKTIKDNFEIAWNEGVLTLDLVQQTVKIASEIMNQEVR